MGGSVTLRWAVKNMLTSFEVYSSKFSRTNPVASDILPSWQTGFIVSGDKPYYTNRISVTQIYGQPGDDEYNMTISNLNYSDDGTVFRAVVDKYHDEKNITLTVVGMD